MNVSYRWCTEVLVAEIAVNLQKSLVLRVRRCIFIMMSYLKLR